MSVVFNKEKIKKIEKILETEFSERGDQFRAVLENKELNRKLIIELYNNISILFNCCCSWITSKVEKG